MLLQKLDNAAKHLHWGILRTLGNSRLVTSSMVWLLIVPIGAKLLAPFAGQHTLDLSWFDPDLNGPIAVTIALPFSWQCFYLMSWLFLGGQFVYWFACPEIVRKYADFGDYHRKHIGSDQLRVLLWRVLHSATEGSRRDISELLQLKCAKPWAPQTVFDAVVKTLDNPSEYDVEEPDDRQSRVFFVTLEVTRWAHRVWFWVSGTLFAGGLVLFAWVVLEGVVEVFKLL